jgi:hypothetical protein
MQKKFASENQGITTHLNDRVGIADDEQAGT